MHVGRPAVRALRAAAFTAICVLASATLHVLVGGAAIGTGTLAAAVAATWAGAYCLGGRQRGWPELLALCGLSQYGLHQLFGAQEYPAAALMIPVSSEPVGHQHGIGPGMVLIHLVVALCSSWWLVRGEVALAALLHLSAARVAGVRALLSAMPAVPAALSAGERPRLPLVRTGTARRVPALLAPVISRRGPPPRLARG
ncbi:hypothetical protein ABZ297_04175 [Nonomuraea sp. NPDC005983]|uniref:hypothetical protein n=1 Tax=Nonomuraea sp. NPDC005983 TaxID=3155595 RepID=UPI0033B436B4